MHKILSLIQVTEYLNWSRVFIYKFNQKINLWAVLRWQRNRTGRPISLSQIPQKNIRTLSKSTKQLLNAGRGHQAPRKAAHCLRKEIGKNIKDKKRETKEVGMEIRPRKGVFKKREVSKHQETLSLPSLW